MDDKDFSLHIAKEPLTGPFKRGRNTVVDSGKSDENSITWEVDPKPLNVATVGLHGDKRSFAMQIDSGAKIDKCAGANYAENYSENEGPKQSSHPMESCQPANPARFLPSLVKLGGCLTICRLICDLAHSPGGFGQARHANSRRKRVVSSAIRRNMPRCLDSKTHYDNLLNSILAAIDANVAGVDSAVMLDVDRFISESNDTNIFFVRRGELTMNTAPAAARKRLALQDPISDIPVRKNIVPGTRQN